MNWRRVAQFVSAGVIWTVIMQTYVVDPAWTGAGVIAFFVLAATADSG